MGNCPRGGWGAGFHLTCDHLKIKPQMVSGRKTPEAGSRLVKEGPEAGSPLALVGGLTVAQLGLGVGANYLESMGGEQPFLFLSSGALIQQGGNKHGEMEAQGVHKIDAM